MTGTNGKTTTTGLLHHLLVTGGLDAGCAGNIGDSFAGAVAEARQRPEGDRDIWVVEASSFQLEDTVEFRPDVALLLNLTPDHLDRHGDVDGYGDAKWNITSRQTADDHLIVNADDPGLRACAPTEDGGDIPKSPWTPPLRATRPPQPIPSTHNDSPSTNPP